MAKYSVLNSLSSTDSLSTDEQLQRQQLDKEVLDSTSNNSLVATPSVAIHRANVNKKSVMSNSKQSHHVGFQQFSWNDILSQTFLPALAASSEHLSISDKYDLVYHVGNHYLCILTEHEHIQVDTSKIPRQIVASTKQKLAATLTKRLHHLYSKSENLQNCNDDTVIESVHHIGLTAITVQYKDKTYPIEHDYGSAFFQEDCVLDFDDESQVIQMFSLDSFIQILNLLQTPSDALSFLAYHLNRLVHFDNYPNELTLAKDFLVDPQFFKRAYDVQKKLVEIGLLTKIESRLEKAYHVPITQSTANGRVQKSTIELVNKLQTSSRMFKKLLNGAVKRYQHSDTTALSEPIKILLEESMYTRMSIMEEVLAYNNSTAEEFAQGYLCHQHSYNKFGHHYVLVIYGLEDNAEYSRRSLRQSYSQILTDINSQLQAPVMDEYFILGFDMSQRDDKGNAIVEMDVFHQPGSAMTVMERRLYEQVQALSNYQS